MPVEDKILLNGIEEEDSILSRSTDITPADSRTSTGRGFINRGDTIDSQSSDFLQQSGYGAISKSNQRRNQNPSSRKSTIERNQDETLSISLSNGTLGRGGVNLTLERSELTQEALAEEERREADEEPPTILCCSTIEPDEFQVDLCPRSWFALTDAQNCAHALWKLVFLIACLPCCYCCFITRSLRRKKKRVEGDDHTTRHRSCSGANTRRDSATGTEETEVRQEKIKVTKAHRKEKEDEDHSK